MGMLFSLCERVCWRARKRGIKARTVTLKLRYADFQTLTRSRTLKSPTCSELELYPVVRDLFVRARSRRIAIRLLGIALSNLARHDEQLPLFDEGALHRAVDDIRELYGYDAVSLATGHARSRRRSEM